MSDKLPVVYVIAVPLFLLFLLAGASVLADIPLGDFTRDPAYLGEMAPWSGFLSNLGVLSWCGGATVCFVAWGLLAKQKTQSKRALFYLLAGLYTVLLMFDDLFLLHEEIFPIFLPFDEKFIFAGYGLLLTAGLYYFQDLVLESKYRFLIIAIGFFAMSVGIDLIQDRVELLLGKWRILFEDGCKFIGIICWLAYFWENTQWDLNKLLNSTVE